MLTRISAPITVAAFLIGIASLSAAQSGTVAKSETAVIAWTELVGDDHAAPDPEPTGHTVLRVITSVSTCPLATADGRPLDLSIRQTPSAAFPVTTCQALSTQRASSELRN
jgi:hypothetical protein